LQLYEIAAEKISKIDLLSPKNKEIAELKQSVQDKANCAELKLLCGNRDEFLRSEVPLMEIKNIEVVRVKSQVIQEKLRLPPMESSSLEIPPPPTTSFIFISDFNRLKDNPVAFAEYFLLLNHHSLSIDSNSYGELLDEIIETEMIKCLIVGFDSLANESNIPQLLGCLIKLADVSRIDIAVLFLDEAAKSGSFLQQFLRMLRNLMERSALNERELSILQGLTRIKMSSQMAPFPSNRQKLAKRLIMLLFAGILLACSICGVCVETEPILYESMPSHQNMTHAQLSTAGNASSTQVQSTSPASSAQGNASGEPTMSWECGNDNLTKRISESKDQLISVAFIMTIAILSSWEGNIVMMYFAPVSLASKPNLICNRRYAPTFCELVRLLGGPAYINAGIIIGILSSYYAYINATRKLKCDPRNPFLKIHITNREGGGGVGERKKQDD
uniref:RPAP3_C domain-containing protein n=1 Tax=Elaeophora elaphi TaxID=1147741 RepID=A0A0R3RJ07_9BILA